MNSIEFDARLHKIQESLFNNGFLKNVKSWNFSSSDLAQIQVQLSQVATQTALSLQELDYKKQQINFEQEKMRQELEMAIAREKIQNIKLACDAVASAIQAESIKRSVVDNAAINKTNAYVSYFNVAMNAIANNAASLNSGSMLANISDLVVKMIDKINDDPLASNYDELLSQLVSKALNLKDLGLGNKQVAILASKSVLAPNEPLTLLGLSVFSDNASEFIYKEQHIASKFFVFKEELEGDYEVIFRAQNHSQEWVEDRIYLKVLKPRKIQGECDE